jgi:predicted ATP-grasp superfamily ATP-dependent carboligase
LVIKPARSVSEGVSGRIKLSVSHAASRTALEQLLEDIDPGAYPLLLQQRIVGPGVGIFLLVWDGETVAAFSHKRLREKPPAGGISVYRESRALDHTLMARSRALLDAFGWQGVAMIEFKVDEATGIPYLMEINGRFWGSLQLAIDAGVDFPQLLVAAASGEHPAPVLSYDTTVRSRWWFGDLDHVLIRLKHSDRALALPPGSPGRMATVRAFLTRDKRDRDEIRQADDLGPFRRERAQYFSHLLGR